MAPEPPELLGAGARFHHVGYACRDLEPEAAGLAALGYAPDGAVFTDPRQGVRGLFLTGEGPCLELLAPLEGSDTLEPWLGGAARMYHLAYTVPDIDATAGRCRAAGARVLGEPVPAVAFDQRAICFVMLRGARLLIELIEAAPDRAPVGARPIQ